MSRPNKYPPQARAPLPPSAAPVAPAMSIADALGPEQPEIDVEVELEATAAEAPVADPLDDVRGPEVPAPEAEAPKPLRAFRAKQNSLFSYAGHGLAVRKDKVYTEERYGAIAMDLMAKSKVFELVES